MGKVFISHNSTDTDLAMRVARRVQYNGLRTYLDRVDDALLKDGPGLADHLLGRMAECDQLIAVVSTETAKSWWVPWEIGVSSEKGFRMASFSRSYVSLPTYLEKWPALHSDPDIDLYCKYSKDSETALNRETASVLNEARRMRMRQSRADAFHRNLKKAL